jgi:hypothetical protein
MAPQDGTTAHHVASLLIGGRTSKFRAILAAAVGGKYSSTVDKWPITVAVKSRMDRNELRAEMPRPERSYPSNTRYRAEASKREKQRWGATEDIFPFRFARRRKAAALEPGSSNAFPFRGR